MNRGTWQYIRASSLPLDMREQLFGSSSVQGSKRLDLSHSGPRVAEPRVGEAELESDRRVVRGEEDGLLVGGERFLVAMKLGESPTELSVAFDEVRIELDDPAIGLGDLLETTQSLSDPADESPGRVHRPAGLF